MIPRCRAATTAAVRSSTSSLAVTVAVATRPVSEATGRPAGPGPRPGCRPQGVRPQVPDQPPGLGQVLGGRAPGPLQVAAGLGGPVGQLGLGRLELEDDADEALGQGVVDVAGQPLALGQPAALPLGRRQLAPGRLQLLDQPSALWSMMRVIQSANREPKTTRAGRR